MAKAATETLRSALDASVIVASLLEWHDRHLVAAALVSEALNVGEVVIPGRALIEAYSVMTRMPAPNRVSPSNALVALSESLHGARVVALEATDHWPLLEDLARRGVAGGAAYDADILITAARSGATRLLTLNRRHFERYPDLGIEIFSPI